MREVEESGGVEGETERTRVGESSQGNEDRWRWGGGEREREYVCV